MSLKSGVTYSYTSCLVEPFLQLLFCLFLGRGRKIQSQKFLSQRLHRSNIYYVGLSLEHQCLQHLFFFDAFDKKNYLANQLMFLLVYLVDLLLSYLMGWFVSSAYVCNRLDGFRFDLVSLILGLYLEVEKVYL